MNAKIRIILNLLVIAFLFVQPLRSQSSQNLYGKWMGTLVINEDTRLRIGFHVFSDEHGELCSTVSSIDQGAFDIPVKSTAFENGVLELEIEAFGANYSGKIQDADQITGTFSQGSHPISLDLEWVEAFPIEKPLRPQEPEKPYPYQEVQVSFDNMDVEGVTIAGTLTIPEGEGPHRAAILISGSGPNDRDANIFGHKVFLVLADYLTRQGIAVLRCDDRGAGESTGEFSSADINDLASDVVAACKYLESRGEINPEQIGLIGHSHGASVAPVAAVSYENIAFNVLMAGSATCLADAIIEQTEMIYTQMDVSQIGIKMNSKFLNEIFRIVASGANHDQAGEEFAAFLTSFEGELEQVSEKDLQILELTPPLNPGSIYGFMTPAMKTDLFLAPGDYMLKMNGPVLAINGDKDIQVPVRHLYMTEELLKENGNQDVSIREFKDKNHLFQTSETGNVEEYRELEETMSPEVLACISDWINHLPIK